MVPIKKPYFPNQRCLDMMRQLAATQGILKGRIDIHTGAFFQKGGFDKSSSSDLIRKLRLAPMSFLATQDLKKVKLHFWSNLSPDSSEVQEIFGPLLQNPAYASSIELSQFIPDQECSRVLPSSPGVGSTLCKIYKAQTDPTSTSDLMRVTVLHNYGGAWIDSDVLLIQDMAPILEEDGSGSWTCQVMSVS